MKLDNKSAGAINTFKFSVIQKIAIEYFTSIEGVLIEQFELLQSTQYKARFTVNAKTRRKLEKEMGDNTKAFKAQIKAYSKKNYKMYQLLEGFNKTEQKALEYCIDEVYLFVDELVNSDVDFR